jgi:heterodisulfide reductase subunit A
VFSDSDDHRLSITYAVEGSSESLTEVFDMVVLSTGFRVSAEMIALADKLGIELNRHRFVRTSDFNPVATSKAGIYVAGVVEAPKDIPETMVQASAAACMAAEQLEVEGQPLPAVEEFPVERDISQEEPRVGVFVCDCGYNIGGVVDVEAIVEHARSLPQVVVAETAGHGCSLQSVTHIQKSIREQKLNRIVIGGCSPRTHEHLFQDTLRKAGLNKYLVEIANIRDQDTWVHMNLPDEATEKAKDLVRMAVASVRHRRPLTDYVLPMNKDILVVGGGVSGMNAALNLAKHGFKVD